MSDFAELRSEVNGFPFPDYISFLRSHASGSIEIGAAPDFARQWLAADNTAPAFPRLVVKLHSLALILFPILWIVIAFIQGRVIWGAMAVLIIPLYIALRPMMVNLGGPLKWIIWLGYAFIAANLFGWLGEWTLPVGLTIIAPWLMNKFTYGLSRDTALKTALNGERGFIMLFKAGVVTLRTGNGSYISYR